MKKLKKLLFKAIDDGQIVTLGLSLVIAFTFFQYQKQLKTFQKIHLVGTGTYTCFNRTLQSYTAKLLDTAQSQYLLKDFFENTEDCYSELLQVLEGNFKDSLNDVLVKTNELVVKVNDFHRKLEVPYEVKIERKNEDGLNKQNENDEQSVDLTENKVGTENVAKIEVQVDGKSYRQLLKNKFAALEGSLYYIDERVEAYKNSLEKTISHIYIFFLSLLTLFVYFETLNFFRKRRSSKLNDQVEHQAKDILENQERFSVTLVSDLVKESLEQNNLYQCSKLITKIQGKIQERPTTASFEQTHMHIVKDAEEGMTSSGVNAPLRSQAFVVSEGHEGKILPFEYKDKENEGNEVPRPTLEGVNLGSALNNVISILADKLFTHGVIIDVDIIQNEEIYVWAQPEALEQVFYNVILNSIQACASKTEEKRIYIKTKKIGTTIQVQVTDSGAGLSAKFLEGLNEFHDAVAPLGIGLTICQQFMDEFKGRIRYSNEVNAQGKIIGARVSLFFNEAHKDLGHSQQEAIEDNVKSFKTPKQGKQVVNVVKGKKKEILKEMKSSSTP